MSRIDRVVEGCAKRRVAEARLGSVDACGCGMLHVNLGAFTMRLEAGALRDLVRMLQEALDESPALEEGVATGFRAPRERGRA